MKPLQKNLLLIAILFSGFFIKSLNGYLRWDLNQHIGMVDNYIENNSFYPTDNSIYSTVSIYPMGVRIIALLMTKTGIDENLIPLMLIVAVLVLCSTILIFFKNPFNNKKIEDSSIPIIISYILICCNYFIFYSVEFKPDTFAYLLCFSGLILYLNNKKTILISSLLIGSSVLFKQHSISFIFGLMVYGFYNYKSSIKYLSLLSSLIYVTIFIIIYSNKTVSYFSFGVVGDDGIRPISDIFVDLYNTLSNLFIFAIFLIFTIKEIPKKIVFKNILSELKNNPYLIICSSILGVSYLGSLINGGNEGNTQVGMFFFIPFLISQIQKLDINYNRALLVCIVSFFLNCNTLFQPIRTYLASTNLKNDISEFISKNDVKRILIDSNTYSLVREYRKQGIRIDDYYTPNMMDNDFNILDLDFDSYDLIVVHKSSLEGVKMESMKFVELVQTTNFIVYNSLSY